MELTEYLRVARKRWPSIVVAALLGVGAGAAVTIVQTPTYRATTQVVVSTQSGDTSLDLAQSNTYSLSRVKTYAQLASSERVLDGVIDLLGLDVESHALAASITATPVSETTIIQIGATSVDPVEAADLANATATSLADVVAEVESIDGQPSPVRISTVEEAVVPTVAVSPRPAVNVVVGGFLGLLAGLVVAVLREVLDTRIRSPRDVETVTRAPIVGTIGHDPKSRQRPLIMHEDPRNPLAEAYRTMRTNLQFVEVDGAQRTFVVTSSIASEGKSTTSANLAIALASTGQTVLLVDADLRKPKIADYLGLEGGVGLTNVLIGRAAIVDAVQEWGASGLYVLPAGRVPPNPSELLGSKTMQTLMRNLESEFDWVIVDAPPLLPVTDAAVLATRASGAIVVVASGKTTSHQLEAAVGLLATVDARVAGIALTMLPSNARYGYGYGYGYGGDEAVARVPRTRTRRASSR